MNFSFGIEPVLQSPALFLEILYAMKKALRFLLIHLPHTSLTT